MRKLILEILIIAVIINSGFFIYRRFYPKVRTPKPALSKAIPKDSTTDDLKKRSPNRLPLCRPESGNAAGEGDFVGLEPFGFVREFGETRRIDLHCDDGRTAKGLEVLAKGSTVGAITNAFFAKLRAAGAERLAVLRNGAASANVYEWQREGRPGRASLEQVSDGTLIRVEVFKENGNLEEKNNPTPTVPPKKSD